MKIKIILIIINIILSTILVIWVAVEMWQQSITYQSEILKTTEQIEDDQDLILKTEKYRQIEQEAIKIFKALPEAKDIPNLLIQFETLAAINEINFLSIDFSTQDEEQLQSSDDPFRAIEANIRVSGTYDEFKRYLKALETNIRSMDVTLITFQAGAASNQDSSINNMLEDIEYNLTIKVYYQ